MGSPGSDSQFKESPRFQPVTHQLSPKSFLGQTGSQMWRKMKVHMPTLIKTKMI